MAGGRADVADGGEGTGRQQAASTLLAPLGELRKRMEGLESMLNDEATDMAAKLGEVAQVTMEMAELQSLAHRTRPASISTTDLEPNGQPSPSGSAHSSPDTDASTRGREPWREPLTFTPASSTPAADSRRVNLALEGLDALDLDELLARLEAGEKL